MDVELCLDIYTRTIKTYFHTKKTYAGLFTIAKNLQKSKYPSMGEWINKWWYVHTVAYYLYK